MRTLDLLRIQLVESCVKELFGSSQYDDRVWIYVLLEFGFEELLQRLFVHFIRCLNLLSRCFIYYELRFRFLVLDKEHTESIAVAAREPIKDIASVLAVVLVQPPSHSLVYHLLWDVLSRELLMVSDQILLDINLDILVIRVCFSSRFI